MVAWIALALALLSLLLLGSLAAGMLLAVRKARPYLSMLGAVSYRPPQNTASGTTQVRKLRETP